MGVVDRNPMSHVVHAVEYVGQPLAEMKERRPVVSGTDCPAYRLGASRVYSKRLGLPPLVEPIVALRPPSAESSYTMRFG